MNTSSVFKGLTYRCLRVPEVQVAMHSLLSVVILVKPLHRNNYKMNYYEERLKNRASEYRIVLLGLLSCTFLLLFLWIIHTSECGGYVLSLMST